MGGRTLIQFFGFTFALTWGLGALLFLITDQVVAIFGEVSQTNLLFILAVYAPGIVGVLLVWRHYGLGGLASFFRRLTIWRLPAAWWVFLVVGIPALFVAGSAITGTISDSFPFTPWYAALPALALVLLVGPIEEFGWRGVALPLLQRRLAPLWASLMLGSVWAIWHLPSFFVSGAAQEAWSFAPFFIGIVALSVALTPIFNAARGSLLVAVIFHFQVNNPLWADIHPWDTILFSVAAIIIVLVNRDTMLSRGTGVTEILMPDEVRQPQAHEEEP